MKPRFRDLFHTQESQRSLQGLDQLMQGIDTAPSVPAIFVSGAPVGWTLIQGPGLELQVFTRPSAAARPPVPDGAARPTRTGHGQAEN